MRPFNPVVWTLLVTELRMLLRDRRTVFLSLLLPLLVMPLMLFSGHFVQTKRERELESTEYRYAITGPRADAARCFVEAARQLPPQETRGKPEPFRFREETPPDAMKALEKGDLHFVLEAADEVPPKVEAKGKPKSWMEVEPPVSGVPALAVLFRGSSDGSSSGAHKMLDALRRVRAEERSALLRRLEFPVTVAEVAKPVLTNLASAAQVAGLALGSLATLMLVMFIMLGGSVIATDTLAGEKERGTLETLLSTAASRMDIITAKLLAIMAVALTITLIQVLNFLLYMVFRIIPVSRDMAAAVTPGVALLVLLLFLPVAALASAVLLLVSGHARTYKEAQLYFLPVFLLAMVPGAAPFLPGISLNSAIVLVPVANVAVAVKEILTGTFHWPMIALTFLVTTAAAAWTTRHTARALSTEHLVGSPQQEAKHVPGPVRFSRQVLVWFAGMWALSVMASGHIGDIRLQLAVNLILIMGGGTFLMVRKYGLDPRKALSLRMPHPAVWIAVALGAPAGILTMIGIARLANLVFPVPREVLEAFGKSLLPEGMSFVPLLLGLSLLPGIFEELAFRGVLLHGLSRRLRPIPRALVVGVLFGLFHFSLFRLVPTAFLGVLLAALTMLSGSIFPAMLWHALNNGLSILAARYQVSVDDLPAGLYLAGAAVLAAVGWILWRTRRPGWRQ